MADDNYLITITYKVDPGNTTSEAAAAGMAAGNAFGANFKPQTDWVNKFLNPQDFAKKTVSSFQDAFKQINLGASIEAQLSGIDLSKANIPEKFKAAVAEGIKSAPALIPPPAPVAAAPRAGTGVSAAAAAEVGIAQRIQPVLSGLEAIAMLFRGAPLLSVAQMAGQSLLEAQRVGAAIAPSRTFFPGGRPGETEEAAIARRLGSITGEPPPPPTPGIGSRLVANVGPIGAGIGAAVGVGAAAISLQEQTGAFGEKAAGNILTFNRLKEVMGTTDEELIKLTSRFERAGVPVEELMHGFYRLAITAARSFPAIQREVADANNQTLESNIKVSSSHRAVEQAQDNRQAATQRQVEAEAELVKVQQTGAALMEQQRRAAELGVTGAVIGERGAEMRARQAQINLQFAPQEAALADVRGPLTVEGAQLGRRGAAINLEEARARFRARTEGEAEDPQEAELRQQRKEQLQLQTARHNLDQADLREREATLAEQKRVSARAAGLGPEAQAQQAALEAAQAQEMARLQTERLKTAQERLAIEQQAKNFAAQEAEAQRKAAEARRNVPAAEEAVTTAEIAERRAREEQDRLKYRQPSAVQQVIGGGPAPEGFDIRRIEPQALREAMILQGGGTAQGVIEALGKFIRGEAMQALPEEKRAPQQLEAISAVLGARGLTDATRYLGVLRKPEGAEDAEGLRIQKEMLDIQKQNLDQAKIVKEEAGKRDERVRLQEARTGVAAMRETPDILQQRTVYETTLIAAQKLLESEQAARGAVDGWATAIKGAATTGADAINGAATELSNAIKSKATEIGSIVIPKPQERQAEKPAELGQAIEQAGGGMIHGMGTGTSDQVPIMASPGEFVVKASEVNKPGALQHLEGINAGRVGFAAGGLVSEAERQEMLDRGFNPDDAGSVARWRAFKVGTHTGAAPTTSGPTGGGVIARGQVARAQIAHGPAPSAQIRNVGDEIPGIKYAPGHEPGSLSEEQILAGQKQVSTAPPGLETPMNLASPGKDLATPMRLLPPEEDKDKDETAAAAGGYVANLIRGFADGGLVSAVAKSVSSLPGSNGSSNQVAHNTTSSGIGGLNTLGFHQLDIRTNAGSFTAAVSEDTMTAIRQSSLNGKISSLGPKPTWYS